MPGIPGISNIPVNSAGAYPSIATVQNQISPGAVSPFVNYSANRKNNSPGLVPLSPLPAEGNIAQTALRAPLQAGPTNPQSNSNIAKAISSLLQTKANMGIG